MTPEQVKLRIEIITNLKDDKLYSIKNIIDISDNKLIFSNFRKMVTYEKLDDKIVNTYYFYGKTWKRMLFTLHTRLCIRDNSMKNTIGQWLSIIGIPKKKKDMLNYLADLNIVPDERKFIRILKELKDNGLLILLDKFYYTLTNKGEKWGKNLVLDEIYNLNLEI